MALQQAVGLCTLVVAALVTSVVLGAGIDGVMLSGIVFAIIISTVLGVIQYWRSGKGDHG